MWCLQIWYACRNFYEIFFLIIIFSVFIGYPFNLSVKTGGVWSKHKGCHSFVFHHICNCHCFFNPVLLKVWTILYLIDKHDYTINTVKLHLRWSYLWDQLWCTRCFILTDLTVWGIKCGLPPLVWSLLDWLCSLPLGWCFTLEFLLSWQWPTHPFWY